MRAWDSGRCVHSRVASPYAAVARSSCMRASRRECSSASAACHARARALAGAAPAAAAAPARGAHDRQQRSWYGARHAGKPASEPSWALRVRSCAPRRPRAHSTRAGRARSLAARAGPTRLAGHVGGVDEHVGVVLHAVRRQAGRGQCRIRLGRGLIRHHGVVVAPHPARRRERPVRARGRAGRGGAPPPGAHEDCCAAYHSTARPAGALQPGRTRGQRSGGRGARLLYVCPGMCSRWPMWRRHGPAPYVMLAAEASAAVALRPGPLRAAARLSLTLARRCAGSGGWQHPWPGSGRVRGGPGFRARVEG